MNQKPAESRAGFPTRGSISESAACVEALLHGACPEPLTAACSSGRLHIARIRCAAAVPQESESRCRHCLFLIPGFVFSGRNSACLKTRAIILKHGSICTRRDDDGRATSRAVLLAHRGGHGSSTGLGSQRWSRDKKVPHQDELSPL